ncbi:MAG TPA: alpha/beta fold hydrolase [Kofleriaceae bacterium]|nr:alpha/beta fold hydrolase [Kofleriaceae bacterium]
MRRRELLRWIGGAVAASAGAACAMRARSAAGGTERLDAARFHATRRFATTRFGRIAYVERGAGDAALFLHGFPLNGFQWRGALERLAPYRRCIAPDFLAMGYTEVNDGQSVGPNDQVEMLVAFLDALAIARVDVVANDSGGAVAQLLVARSPERIRSVLLTNCDVEVDSPPAALLPVIELAKQGQFVDRWLAAWRRDKPRARSAEGIGGMCYADPAQPTDEAIETYFAPLVASPRRKALVHAYAIALAHNPLIGIEYALDCSKAPVRIVWGMADTIFSRDSPDYLDHTVGNSRGVRRLAGSKLFWPEERPDVIAEEARALWAHAA